MLLNFSFPSEIFFLDRIYVHECGYFCVFCSLIYLEHLEECQARERYSIFSQCMNSSMNGS